MAFYFTDVHLTQSNIRVHRYRCNSEVCVNIPIVNNFRSPANTLNNPVGILAIQRLRNFQPEIITQMNDSFISVDASIHDPPLRRNVPSPSKLVSSIKGINDSFVSVDASIHDPPLRSNVPPPSKLVSSIKDINDSFVSVDASTHDPPLRSSRKSIKFEDTMFSLGSLKEKPVQAVSLLKDSRTMTLRNELMQVNKQLATRMKLYQQLTKTNITVILSEYACKHSNQSQYKDLLDEIKELTKKKKSIEMKLDSHPPSPITKRTANLELNSVQWLNLARISQDRNQNLTMMNDFLKQQQEYPIYKYNPSNNSYFTFNK